MGGFLRRFSTALMNQASEGMEAKQAADAKVAEEIKVQEGKLYDKYFDYYLGMKKTMFEKPEQWYTTHNGVRMNWQQAEPTFMDLGLLKVDNLDNLKNTVDLLSNFKPEKIDDKTSKTWEKLLAGIVDRTKDEAAYSRKITDLQGKVTKQFWKDAQTTEKWKEIFKEETSDEAFKFFTAFKKVGEPKNDKEESMQTNVLFGSLNLENEFSHKVNKTNNYANSVDDITEFDNLFSSRLDDLDALWESQDTNGKKVIAKDILTSAQSLFLKNWQLYKTSGGGPKTTEDLNTMLDNYPSVKIQFNDLMEFVGKHDDLKFITQKLLKLDENKKIEILQTIENQFGDGNTISHIATDELSVNNNTNTPPIVGFKFSSPESEARYRPTFDALAVQLGYNNFDALYKVNPQATENEYKFAAKLINLNGANGNPMFLSGITSAEPWVTTIFDDGQGISDFSKTDQSILAFFLRSSNLTQSQQMRTLGMIVDWNKNHIPDSGQGDFTRKKRNEITLIASQTARSILYNAGYVDDDSDAVLKVLTAVKNNPVEGLGIAQARLAAVHTEGRELHSLLEQYAQTVTERKKTGFAGWLRETANSLFGSDGSQWNQLAGQGFFASADFLADMEEEGEIIGADGNQVYKGTVDFIQKYIDQHGDDSSAKGIADGRAAALRIYIAYKMAKYFDPTGRVSDRDLQNQLDAFIGTETSSFENVIGMLSVASGRVNQRLEMQSELINTGRFFKADGKVNAQYVNRMKGVENFKYLMHDSGMMLAERFINYKPNTTADHLLNTGKTTANGSPIFQLMHKKNPNVPRMGGPPMFGLFYSKDKDTGEYSFVPWHLVGAGEQSASPESSTSDTGSTLEKVPDMEGFWRKKVPVPNSDQFRWEFYDNPEGTGDALPNPFINI